MSNLPEFKYNSFTVKTLDLENFFKDFEMSKFLDECDYSESEMYAECIR